MSRVLLIRVRFRREDRFEPGTGFWTTKLSFLIACCDIKIESQLSSVKSGALVEMIALFKSLKLIIKHITVTCIYVTVTKNAFPLQILYLKIITCVWLYIVCD